MIGAKLCPKCNKVNSPVMVSTIATTDSPPKIISRIEQYKCGNCGHEYEVKE